MGYIAVFQEIEERLYERKRFSQQTGFDGGGGI